MVLDKFRNALTSLGSRGSKDDSVVLPSDPSIIRKASKSTGLQKEKVKDAISRFQEAGSVLHPLIKRRAVKGEVSNAEKIKGKERPSFVYLIDENDEVLVVGGAANIIYSLANRLELTGVETRSINVANQLAAEANGYAEHMVMDDVLVIPKKTEEANGSSKGEKLKEQRAKQKLREKLQRVSEIEANGYSLTPRENLMEGFNAEEKEYVGVDYEARGGEIGLVFDPNPHKDVPDVGVVTADGDVLVSEGLASAFGLDHREIGWSLENGRIVATVLSEIGTKSDDINQKIRTSVAVDEVEGELYAHLSGDHLLSIELDEGDEAAVYLDTLEDSIKIVLTPEVDEAPGGMRVEVQNRGTGTEMLCFTVPEGIAESLELYDETRRQIEWGLGDGEVLGEVIESESDDL